jgi:hypothetical protein
VIGFAAKSSHIKEAIVIKSGTKRDEKGIKGIFHAKLRVLATIAPIRVPVKDPGPTPMAIRFGVASATKLSIAGISRWDKESPSIVVWCKIVNIASLLETTDTQATGLDVSIIKISIKKLYKNTHLFLYSKQGITFFRLC